MVIKKKLKIGIKRIDEHVDENKETNNKLYKIKFNKIECDYNLNEDKLDDCSESIYIEYEEYIPKYTEEHCLSSMDNMVWQQEENILKLNRKDLNFTMRLEDGKVFVSNLPASLSADVVDARNNEHQLDLKLSENKKIKSIKPISNEIQVKISEENRTKMFYMDSSFISSTENYMYKIKDLKDKPPLSFHSLVGENNYNNYHSGQPFSSQSPSHFSSRHVPFFSSIIDNVRIHLAKAKQQRIQKEYKKMASDIAKSIDPGFRGFLSNIKGLTNTSTSPCNNKYKASHSAKENKKLHYAVLNRYVKGINNGKTQGEVVYSIVKDLKEKDSITITHFNGIRAFFGIDAFSLIPQVKANLFLLANYSKTHSITFSKSENNRVKFSFINKKEENISAGLSAGIGSYKRRWKNNSIDYGFNSPLTASIYLDLNHNKKSNFSFEIDLDDVVEFIDKGLDFSLNQLKDNTTLNNNENISLGLFANVRSEFRAQ